MRYINKTAEWKKIRKMATIRYRCKFLCYISNHLVNDILNLYMEVFV